MSLGQGIIEEFSIEATELLDEAEDSLLKYQSAENYQVIYNSVFRAFHSLKGSSGMMGFNELQGHLHLLEDFLQKSKGNTDHFFASIDYYLNGIDAARKILAGENVAFKYQVFGASENKEKTVVESFLGEGIIIVSNIKQLNLTNILEASKKSKIKLSVVDNALLSEEYLSKLNYDFILTDFKDDELTRFIPLKKNYLPIMKLVTPDEAIIAKENVFLIRENEAIDIAQSIFTNVLFAKKQSEIYNHARGIIMYMFSDMEEFLLSNNRNGIHLSLTSEIKTFIKKYGR